MLKVSVIIPTADRKQTTEAMFAKWSAELTEPHDAIFIDGTTEPNNQIQISHPRVKILRQPDASVVTMRNLAAALTLADLLLFIDDDACPHPKYLINLIAIAEKYPDCHAFCGPVIPSWETNPPIPKTAYRFINAFDQGPRPRLLAFPTTPIGTNLCIRRRTFEKLKGFTALPIERKKNHPSAEDIELTYKIYRHRFQLLYHPNLRVDHYTNPARCSEHELLKKATADGQGIRTADQLHFGLHPWTILRRLVAYLDQKRSDRPKTLAGRLQRQFWKGYANPTATNHEPPRQP
jgi:GT2 family glycosyltransferase